MKKKKKTATKRNEKNRQNATKNECNCFKIEGENEISTSRTERAKRGGVRGRRQRQVHRGTCTRLQLNISNKLGFLKLQTHNLMVYG